MPTTTETSPFPPELGLTPELIGRHATRARWLGIGFIIAVLVFTAWPASSVWFIGILLGVDFLVMGVLLNLFASACRRDPELWSG